MTGANNSNNYQQDPVSLQKDAVSKLIESSCLNEDFYLMLVLSSIIVSLGLLLNNIIIVIGGMVVTPFLSPILRLALAVVVSEKEVIRGSLFIILKAVGVIVLASIFTSFLVPKHAVDLSLFARIADTDNIYYFYVSLTAGLAAAFAWAKPNLSEILPGVAIGVAILPPLVGIGISLVLWDGALMAGSIRSSIANVLGTLLSATFVFGLLGFYRVRKHLRKEVKEVENK